MFVIDVKKAKPTITQMEPLITSNSINAFSVQFIFSEEWDGMQRFAVFKTPQSDPMQILLDDTNICDIPWELLEEDGPKVLVGAYGLKDDGKEVRLPTIWITIDSISEGVLEGYEVSDPTPDIYSQFIEALNRLQKPGTTFIPHVSDEGEISWTNDDGKENPETVNIRGTTFTPAISEDGTISFTNDRDAANPDPVNVRGVTFTPSVDDDGNISWTNDKDKENPETKNIRGPKGDTGTTFTPSVDDDGNLTWSNDDEKDNPETKNIRGQKGDTGTTFTPSVDDSGNLSWSNDDGKDNPETVNIRGPKGEVGPPSSIFVTGPIGAIIVWEKPDEIPTGWDKYEDPNMPELPEGTCYIRKETVDEDDIDFIPGETLTLSKESILNVKKPNQGVYTREEFEALPEEAKSKGLFVVLEDDENGSGGGQSSSQKSLYEQFVDRGYTGTEEEFDALIASGPWLSTKGGVVDGDIDLKSSGEDGPPSDAILHVTEDWSTPSSTYPILSLCWGSVETPFAKFSPNVHDFCRKRLTNVSDPVLWNDAANMNYVDNGLNAKQAKLSGSQGQLVGFDANGNAIAQAPPVSMTSADLDIWSTEERIVGTWFDGSPIYERTIHPGSLTYVTDQTNGDYYLLSNDISYIDSIISVNGFARNGRYFLFANGLNERDIYPNYTSSSITKDEILFHVGNGTTCGAFRFRFLSSGTIWNKLLYTTGTSAFGNIIDLCIRFRYTKKN